MPTEGQEVDSRLGNTVLNTTAVRRLIVLTGLIPRRQIRAMTVDPSRSL
jgi:hypothetical protein